MASNEANGSNSKKIIWAILTIILLPALAIIAKKAVERWSSAPDVKVLSMNPPDTYSITDPSKHEPTIPFGKSVKVEIKVQNEGNIAAENCYVEWRLDITELSMNGNKAIEREKKGSFYKASPQFGLASGETKSLSLDTPILDTSGEGKLIAHVKCSNGSSPDKETSFAIFKVIERR